LILQNFVRWSWYTIINLYLPSGLDRKSIKSTCPFKALTIKLFWLVLLQLLLRCASFSYCSFHIVIERVRYNLLKYLHNHYLNA
jgi:hypothetical protein